MTTYSDLVLAPALAASAFLKMNVDALGKLRCEWALVRYGHETKSKAVSGAAVDAVFAITDDLVAQMWKMSGRDGTNPFDSKRLKDVLRRRRVR